jgi:hypothetical protein
MRKYFIAITDAKLTQRLCEWRRFSPRQHASSTTNSTESNLQLQVAAKAVVPFFLSKALLTYVSVHFESALTIHTCRLRDLLTLSKSLVLVGVKITIFLKSTVHSHNLKLIITRFKKLKLKLFYSCRCDGVLANNMAYPKKSRFRKINLRSSMI